MPNEAPGLAYLDKSTFCSLGSSDSGNIPKAAVCRGRDARPRGTTPIPPSNGSRPETVAQADCFKSACCETGYRVTHVPSDTEPKVRGNDETSSDQRSPGNPCQPKAVSGELFQAHK